MIMTGEHGDHEIRVKLCACSERSRERKIPEASSQFIKRE